MAIQLTRRQPARRAGFTLVELLVVVAIIALLLGILLPALNRAKRLANVVKRTTNTRSIVQGIDTYLHDSSFTYPAGNQDAGFAPPATITRDISLHLHNLTGKEGDPAATTSGSFPPLAEWDEDERLLNEYTGNNPKLSECPLDAGDRAFNRNINKAFDFWGSSYFYPNVNSADLNRDVFVRQFGLWAVEGRKQSDIDFTSTKVLVGDIVLMTNRDASLTNHHWHNEGGVNGGVDDPQLKASVGFADGHAEEIERKTGDDILASNPDSYENNLTAAQIEEMATSTPYH